MYKFDFLVFIGRLQPPHNGHIKVIQQAMTLAKTVIVVLGSAEQPRTPKNPFTTTERAAMLIGGFEPRRPPMPYDVSRLRIAKVRDSMYNDQRWTNDIQEAVQKEVGTSGWTDYPPKIGLIGHKKDESSFYLDLFPQWEFVPHDYDEILSATDLREVYFEKNNMGFLKSLVPHDTFKYMWYFKGGKDFERLVDEYHYIKKYKDSWKVAPYPPTFVTTDSIVVQSGHILMVQRKATPGEGLLALPGGFLNNNERIVDGAIRELLEETRIKVPEKVLRGSIKNQHVFDHPNRSQRGRTITHAIHIELPPGALPKVKGSDDARNAAWLKTSEIGTRWNELFEDHGDIISYFVGV